LQCVALALSTQHTMMNATSTVPIPESCDAMSLTVMAATCLVGIVVCFAGYRLYVLSLGLSGFVMAATVQVVTGFSWISQGEEEEHQRILKTFGLILFCLLWGGIGILPCVCTKFSDNFKRCLGSMLGAALGIALVGALIYVLKRPVSDALGAGHEGWEPRAFVCVAPLVALLFGWLVRNRMKCCLMMVTALLGATVAVGCLELIRACFVVDFNDTLRIPIARLCFVGALGLPGFGIQVNTDPARAEVGKSEEDEVAKSEEEAVEP